MSFVVLLSGIVITLRRVGDHVGTPVALTGASGQVSGTTMRHTLAVTLLPFLWIYATLRKDPGSSPAGGAGGFMISGTVHGDSLERLNPRTPRDYRTVSGVVLGATWSAESGVGGERYEVEPHLRPGGDPRGVADLRAHEVDVCAAQRDESATTRHEPRDRPYEPSPGVVVAGSASGALAHGSRTRPQSR